MKKRKKYKDKYAYDYKGKIMILINKYLMEINYKILYNIILSN